MSSVSSDVELVVTESESIVSVNGSTEPLIMEIETTETVRQINPRPWYKIPEVWMYFVVLFVAVLASAGMTWYMAKTNMELRRAIRKRIEKRNIVQLKLG